MSKPATSSPGRSRIAPTPMVSRPIGRTSFSVNREPLPRRVTMSSSLPPDERRTQLSSSSPWRLIAISPLRRTAEYAAAGVFLIWPSLVTMTRYCESLNSSMSMSAVTRSPWSRSMRLITGSPLAWRLTSGISWVRSRYTRPRLVKNSMSVCVFAVVECAM